MTEATPFHMTAGLRSSLVSRSTRVIHGASRAAIAVGLFAGVAIVTPMVTGGDGRTIEAAADATFGAGGEYHSLTPQRVLDTRDPALDVEPLGRKPFTTDAGVATFDVPIVGKGGLPALSPGADCFDDNVLAVAVNVTVVNPTHGGWLRAWGKDAPEGGSSLVNFNPGQVVPNSALLRPGCDGKLTIKLYTPNGAASADVLIDVFGWISSSSYPTRGARLEPAGPGRIFDSREAAFGATPFLGGSQHRIQIRGVDAYDPTRADIVPNDANIVGVLVNVTGVNNLSGSQATHISLLPGELAPGEQPTTSNVNLRVGQVRSNLAIVPLSADGAIWVYTHAGRAHVVLDVMGYFIKNNDDSRRGRMVPLVAPFRAFDTRETTHFDQPLPPANAEDWSFTDFSNDVKVAGAPIGNQLGVIGNLTGAALARQYSWATVASYITAYPTPLPGSSTTPPLISNLGIVEGEVVPNLVVLPFGSNGTDNKQIRFYNRAGYLDYLLDVSAVILAD
jgi:hypothetical protein